ncbi:MFS transporter [Allokutzneria sp. A3M-2-11 16]|uniref:MFS transporter n=1 Tax=Allokutzneria sp. A3M-2-11 16 TaxID=2962043 RepID=UPI0020B65842|nr:MFS transporter [Allokutzneria sp. A3M-2-11 16]MCP3799280.1 MFS transporter [Allokutzneria sp. A3M-2-11 16]
MHSPPALAERRTFAPLGRTVTALGVAAVLVVSQLYASIPLSALTAADFGVAESALAWSSTGFGLAYALGFLFLGPLSDRFGPGRVMVVGLAVAAVTTAAVAIAPGVSALVVLRAIQGFTAAAFAPAAMAYVAEQIDPRRRAIAYTILTSAFVSSAVIGQVGAQLLGDLAGWRAVFVVSGIGLFACAVWKKLALRADLVERPAVSVSPWRVMLELLRNRRLVLLFAAASTLLAGFVGAYSGIQITGLADHDGLLWLRASALPAMVLTGVAAPFVTRLPAPRRAVVALGFSAVGAAITTVSGGSLVLIGVGMFLFSACVVAAGPALVESIGDNAGPARATAVSIYSFVLFIGASLGPQLAVALHSAGFVVIALAVTALLALGTVLARLAR